MNTTSRLTLTSMMGRWRPSTVSLSCPQIPPLEFEGEDTVWHTGQFISVEPSSPSFGRSSLRPRYTSGTPSAHSRRTSIASRRSSFSRGSVTLRLERQQSGRSSILHMPNTSGPLSPLQIALTTRASVWKIGGQPRVITKATMEGLIHYMLLNPASERFTRLQLIFTYKLIFAEADMEQHDIFFIGHLAFISPLNVLGMLFRRFDDALMCPDEVCTDVQTRLGS
jgi:hypothetical protein